jgi:photosystem II stability/assembly factor-like uncharacterized protein
MKRLITVFLFSLLLSPAGRPDQLTATVQADSSDLIASGRGACQSRPYINRAPHGWTNIGPGTPGVRATVAVDPRDSGTIYVGSVGGGVRKSTDNGATWSSASFGLNGTAVFALAMDASGPDTVYAGVFNAALTAPGGVFKSIDGGATWTFLDQTAMTIPQSLAAHPNASGVVYMADLGQRIFKTVDGGANWIRVFTGPAAVTSIIIDPIDPNTVYATTLAGFLKSVNEGATWSLMSGLSSEPLWDVAIDPTNHDVLYVATNTSGVWQSPDAGASWQPTGVLPGVPYSVVVDPSPAHTIFAGTSGGVWKSSDSGSSWQSTALIDRAAQSITIGAGGILYAGTTAGPAISEDLGATWRDPDPGQGGAQAFGYAVTVDPNSGCKLFASTLGSAVLISDKHHGRHGRKDGGVSWTRVGTDYAVRESRKIAVDPTDSSRVYSGSFYSGLFKSVDGGATWSGRSFGSGSAYVWIPVVDPVSPNIVYAGTVGEGLFKSEDYGDSWTSVPGLPATVQGLTVDPRNNQELFAAASNGIYRSEDMGQTWLRVLDLPAWSITIVGGASPVVYATTKRDGVYRSLDGGRSWEAKNDGITDKQMGRSAPVIVAPEHSEVLYVASEGGGGVFKSSDGGETWFPVNLGLFDTSVFGLAADPRRPGTLYASGPHGIFATTSGGR